MTRPQRVTLAAVLLLAAALRLHGLGAVAPIEDEYFQFLEGLQPTLGRFLASIRHNPHHLLIDPLASFLAARCGDSPFWLRLPSAMFGVLAVAGLWRLGRKEGDSRRGAAAALLLAVSLVHIDLSRRADFYALVTAISIWQTLAFFRFREQPDCWPLYAAMNAAFLHAHPYAVIFGALQAAHVLGVGRAGPRERWRFVWAWGAAAAAFLPWFFYSAASLLDWQTFHLYHEIGLRGHLVFLQHLPLYFGQATETGPDYGWSLSAGPLLSIAYLLLYLISAYRTWKGGRPAVLRFCHWVLPIGLLAVLSLDRFYQYFLAHRQTLFLLPFYLLAVADGACLLVDHLLPSAWRSRALAAAGAAMALMNLPAYCMFTDLETGLGRGHEAMVSSVAAHILPGDVIASSDPVLLMSLLYFYDRKALLQADLGLRPDDGLMIFRLPPGLSARRGAAANEVRVMEAPPDAPCWWLRGRLDDLSIDPPTRHRPPVARPSSTRAGPCPAAAGGT